MALPLLALSVAPDALSIAPCDAAAAERLPVDTVGAALERYTLIISNATLRALSLVDRMRLGSLARAATGLQLRSFGWPILFCHADQPVPAMFAAFARRAGSAQTWSLAGLAEAQRLAAHEVLETGALSAGERERLTASMHWSL